VRSELLCARQRCSAKTVRAAVITSGLTTIPEAIRRTRLGITHESFGATCLCMKGNLQLARILCV